MDISIWSVLMLIGMSAFFSCMEAAYVSMDRVTIRRFKNSDGVLEKIIFGYLKNIDSFLVSTILGNLIINIVIVWYTQDFLHSISLFLPKKMGSILLILMQSLFLLVICDITPKRLGMRYSEFFSYSGAIPMAGVYFVTYPISKGLLSIKDWIEKYMRVGRGFSEEVEEEQEILDYIRSSYEQGELGESEGNVLYNLVAYREAFVDTVLITRMNIKGIDLENLPTKLSREVMQFEYDVIPVYKGVTDNIVGVLDKRKIFLKGGIKNLQITTLKKYMERPHIINKSLGLVDAFLQMYEKGTKLSVVLDEYGGVSGIVTYKDICSLLLGQSIDVEEESSLSMKTEVDCCVKGSVDLVNFNKMFGTSLHSDKANTVGGYILELAGDIPVRGDMFEVGEMTLCVEEVTKRGIRFLKASRKTQ